MSLKRQKNASTTTKKHKTNVCRFFFCRRSKNWCSSLGKGGKKILFFFFWFLMFSLDSRRTIFNQGKKINEIFIIREFFVFLFQLLFFFEKNFTFFLLSCLCACRCFFVSVFFWNCFQFTFYNFLLKKKIFLH